MDSLFLKKSVATLSIALGAVFMPGIAGFESKSYAQSEASVALSVLPIASVAVVGVGASTAAGAVIAAPVILSAAGAVIVVKAVEVTARGTVYVLERASDGARVSLEISGKSIKASAIGVGTVVAVTVIGSGLVLSAAGEALAFIPNELGKALLHNERITY
jgi:hypothetical protein